jgi:F0F1-type ATP synthase assembly protein I
MMSAYGLVGAIVCFGAAGYLLDRWLDTAPWLLLTGLIVGMVVGFLVLLQLVRTESSR